MNLILFYIINELWMQIYETAGIKANVYQNDLYCIIKLLLKDLVTA